MRRQPGAVDQLFLDWGTSGVAASLGVRVLDNEGQTTIARTTGFVEFPSGSGLYYLDPFTFPDERGSYQLVYDDGSTDPGHTATEDLEITSSLGEPFEGDTYATVDELFRILKIRTPSAEQTNAGERVLIAATGEINAELDREDDDPLAGWETSLAQEVCLERAVEHWRQQEAPFGLVTIEGGLGPAERTARDSWERHANKLAPLKLQWGLA